MRWDVTPQLNTTAHTDSSGRLWIFCGGTLEGVLGCAAPYRLPPFESGGVALTGAVGACRGGIERDQGFGSPRQVQIRDEVTRLAAAIQTVTDGSVKIDKVL